MPSKFSKQYYSEEERTEVTEFLEKRAHLLGKIHDLEDRSTSSSDVHDRILRLKEENNHIMEGHMAKMSRIRHGPPVDPCSRLPIEVFTAIIAWTKDPLDWFGWCIDEILSLTLVSTSWRNAILSTPSLWDEINLDGNINDLQMKLLVAFHLSKGTPIKLRIQCSPSLWKEVEPFLLLHRDRITDLTLSIEYMVTRSMESILTILQRLGHLPCLESFRCELWYSEEAVISGIDAFLKENQHIRYVSGILLTEDILRSPIRMKLKGCRTMMEPQAILADLEAAPYLEEVNFMANYLRGINADPYHGLPEVTYLPNAPLRWKNYSQYGKVSPEILDSISTTVTTVTLHICACDLWSLFSILCNFATLDHLDLSLVTGEAHPLMPPPASSPLPCQTLRQLAFRFDIGYSFHAASSQYLQDWQFPFPEVVHQTCGWIESLTLSSQPALRVQWHLIEGFKKLEKLKISTSRPGLVSPPSLVFPSTLKSINISGDETDLSSLRSDTVQALNIYTFGPFKPSQKSSIMLSNWPNLTNISTPAYKLAMDWSGGQMHNLSTVNLGKIGNIAWDHFTHFCCNLALHPKAIPQLTTLTLAQSPEWDILFILLERFNFRTTTDSERIKSLTVGDAPLYLLRPLQMLCAGKFTKRPPNIELCWIGNVDTVFDKSLKALL
ncbi:hypothetical protein FRC17_005430 [Serendipita sp. 399]|nr:hypothetical protein FRC17_005430 [Serendipita sp. 399]